jgi:DNA-binding PadR family transcriptional regulator
MSILHLLASDNFITVNRQIASIVGLEAAVILGELVSEFIYWADRDGLQDGFFFSTVENLESKTFLSAHSQRQALEKLSSFGFVDVEKKGMPAKRYIRINEKAIEDALVVNDKSLKILTTSDEKIESQDVKNFDGNKNIDKKNIEKDHKEKHIPATQYSEILSQASVIADYKPLYDAFIDFIDMRKKIKSPPTERALKMIINEAYKLANGDPRKMKEIVDQSTLHCWKDVYPLKDKDKVQTAPDNNPFTQMLIDEGYDQ